MQNLFCMLKLADWGTLFPSKLLNGNHFIRLLQFCLFLLYLMELSLSNFSSIVNMKVLKEFSIPKLYILRVERFVVQLQRKCLDPFMSISDCNGCNSLVRFYLRFLCALPQMPGNFHDDESRRIPIKAYPNHLKHTPKWFAVVLRFFYMLEFSNITQFVSYSFIFPICFQKFRKFIIFKSNNTYEVNVIFGKVLKDIIIYEQIWCNDVIVKSSGTFCFP